MQTSQLHPAELGKERRWSIGEEKEITDHSSAAEYLTFVASTGDSQDSVEIRYNDRAIQFRKWSNTIVKDYTIKD